MKKILMVILCLAISACMFAGCSQSGYSVGVQRVLRGSSTSREAKIWALRAMKILICINSITPALPYRICF